MAAKGSKTSDEVRAKISASQTARWARIRTKVEQGQIHEDKCASVDETLEQLRLRGEMFWPSYPYHLEASNNPSLFQRFRNWINKKQ